MNGWHLRAEAQYGVVTREQLRETLSDRQIHSLIAGGRLERVHPGVFRVVGSYPSARQRAAAVVLACQPDGLLSHATAARLFRLPIVRPSEIHVTLPRATKRHLDGVQVHRSIAAPDRWLVDGLACTSAVRTIVDIAAACGGEQLETIFDTARRLGLVTAQVFRRRAEPLLTRGRPGTAELRELLRVIDGRPKESRLEVRLARLLRRAGIIPEATQHPVGPYRIDFVLSQARKRGLEADSFEWHGNRLAWKRDKRRIAFLERQGWTIRHVTWDDVTERPAETVDRIRVLCSLATTV
jgi:very-short-patch-repair endonuclease